MDRVLYMEWVVNMDRMVGMAEVLMVFMDISVMLMVLMAAMVASSKIVFIRLNHSSKLFDHNPSQVKEQKGLNRWIKRKCLLLHLNQILSLFTSVSLVLVVSEEEPRQ